MFVQDLQKFFCLVFRHICIMVEPLIGDCDQFFSIGHFLLFKEQIDHAKKLLIECHSFTIIHLSDLLL